MLEQFLPLSGNPTKTGLPLVIPKMISEFCYSKTREKQKPSHFPRVERCDDTRELPSRQLQLYKPLVTLPVLR